jgi:biotin transport system substrate-specific component
VGVRSSYWFRQLLWLSLAVAGLALASQVEIPMRPVPITLQTLAVVLAGFLLGPRLGFVATLIWLAGGAAGLPIFAGGESGIRHLSGPTAGYLLSFPFAAAVAGFAAEREHPRPRVLWLFVAAIVAHLLILAAGGWWLSTKIGAVAAMNNGVIPFLPGAGLKSAVAAIAMKLIGASTFMRR